MYEIVSYEISLAFSKYPALITALIQIYAKEKPTVRMLNQLSIILTKYW